MSLHSLIAAYLVLMSCAAVAQSPIPRGEEVYSVERWGAKGFPADDTAAIQAALDFARVTPCVLFFPAQRYLVHQTLTITNPGRTRASAPTLRGRGSESTSIEFRGGSGPLFDVTGLRAAGQFLHDLSFEKLRLVGRSRDTDEHAIQMMGCYAPSIKNVSITGFGGDGIRVIGDLKIDANPDFTATIFLAIEGCTISRIGGLGFRDHHPIGCPSVSIERSVFNMCGAGGALIRSAGFVVDRSAFAGCGWSGETTLVNAAGIGLQIHAPGGSVSRGLLRACEFDTNRAEHLRMDNFAMARLENNRFIYHDRYAMGFLCPPIGANMAPLGPNSVLTEIVIDGLFHRIDQPGTAVGIKWSNSANVDETSIEVVRTRTTNAPKANFTAVEGKP
ncbi:MAG: right-handed parallel beta-helix repeat-containing protein [Prosthecobacter sp.]|uniref:right-handed parallel beta-helix repeat-containing protein n=1 Tax=Prosthecobacter sp. TaxID=1965333 RepID=UPI0039016572